jgi:hypothetical protein
MFTSLCGGKKETVQIMPYAVVASFPYLQLTGLQCPICKAMKSKPTGGQNTTFAVLLQANWRSPLRDLIFNLQFQWSKNV